MMNEFQIILPSNENSVYSHVNTQSHYITKLAQPIHLDGVWDVGLRAIDYSTVAKELDEIEIGFKFYQCKGPRSNASSNGVFIGEFTDDPYEFKESQTHNVPCKIKISRGSEGINSIKDEFRKKYPSLHNSFGLHVGIEYVKFETIPFEYPAESDIWQFIVPDSSIGWDQLFSADYAKLDNYRWYASDFIEYPPDKITSLSQIDEELEKDENNNVVMGDEDEEKLPPKLFDSDGEEMVDEEEEEITDHGAQFIDEEWNRVKKKLSANQSYDLERNILNSLPHSAISEGAVALSGSTSSLFIDKTLNENYEIPARVYRSTFDPNFDSHYTYDFKHQAPRYFYMKRKDWNISDVPDLFFMYISIIEPSLIADRLGPVLRVIPYNTQKFKGQREDVEFDPVIYKRVNTSTIHDIKVWFASSTGQFVAFPNNSRVIATLHFKKVK